MVLEPSAFIHFLREHSCCLDGEAGLLLLGILSIARKAAGVNMYPWISCTDSPRRQAVDTLRQTEAV